MKRIALGLAALAALWGCVEAEMPVAQDGKALFMENCAVCHGADGRGNGAMARAMTKAPKDLTLISVRHGDSFPRAKVMSTVDGYARSDLSGPGMPEFGELLKGDLIPFDSGDGIQTPTPRKLVALVEYLESIQTSRQGTDPGGRVAPRRYASPGLGLDTGAGPSGFQPRPFYRWSERPVQRADAARERGRGRPSPEVWP